MFLWFQCNNVPIQLWICCSNIYKCSNNNSLCQQQYYSVPIIPVLITVIIQSTILQYNNDDYYSNSDQIQRCPKWRTVSTKINQLFSTTEVYSLQNPNTNWPLPPTVFILTKTFKFKLFDLTATSLSHYLCPVSCPNRPS